MFVPVGVLESVQEQVVQDLPMPQAQAVTNLGQQVRSLAHGFHAAAHDPAAACRHEGIMADHGRLHARTAHLVDGGAGRCCGQSGFEGGLARGRLTLPRLQDTAHQRFVDRRRIEAGVSQGA